MTFTAHPSRHHDPDGIPLIDFEISYVDDVTLPVSMALDDGGATQYMGSNLSHATLPGVISNFLTNGTGWSQYAVYSDHNFPHSKLNDLLSGLAVRPTKVPSGNELIAGVRLASGLYVPSNDDGSYTRECVDPDASHNPPHNLMCALPPPVGAGLKGNCCPNGNPGDILGCGDLTNFLIDDTSRVFDPQLTPPGFEYSNPTFDNLIQRWTHWQGPASNPCSDSGGLDTPALDKAGFYAAFKRTVDFIWDEFAAHSTLEPRADKQDSPFCSQLGDEKQTEHCIVANIIGYTNLVSDFDPEKCKKCPNANTGLCANSCTVEALRNEVVQGCSGACPGLRPETPSSAPGAHGSRRVPAVRLRNPRDSLTGRNALPSEQVPSFLGAVQQPVQPRPVCPLRAQGRVGAGAPIRSRSMISTAISAAAGRR
jgi:hypothetical protein